MECFGARHLLLRTLRGRPATPSGEVVGSKKFSIDKLNVNLGLKLGQCCALPRVILVGTHELTEGCRQKG